MQMQCSGCGKDIPFSGIVCPCCQWDKSKGKAYAATACFFGIFGGAIGYLIFGFWGVLGGLLAGCMAATFATLSGGATPLAVQVASSPVAQRADSAANKLAGRADETKRLRLEVE